MTPLTLVLELASFPDINCFLWQISLTLNPLWSRLLLALQTLSADVSHFQSALTGPLMSNTHLLLAYGTALLPLFPYCQLLIFWILLTRLVSVTCYSCFEWALLFYYYIQSPHSLSFVHLIPLRSSPLLMTTLGRSSDCLGLKACVLIWRR